MGGGTGFNQTRKRAKIKLRQNSAECRNCFICLSKAEQEEGEEEEKEKGENAVLFKLVHVPSLNHSALNKIIVNCFSRGTWEQGHSPAPPPPPPASWQGGKAGHVDAFQSGNQSPVTVARIWQWAFCFVPNPRSFLAMINGGLG